MSLQQRIADDLKLAMKNGEEARKSLLRVIIGEMNRVDKNLPDERVIAIIKKMIEGVKLVGNVEEEKILSEYLPKQLDEAQLTTLISALIFENGYTVKDMGKIMSSLKEKYNGQYDGKIASTLVKNLLSTPA